MLRALFTLSILWLAVPARADWPGERSEWKGFAKYAFSVEDRASWVVVPKHPAPGLPWVWRARFPGFHSRADEILVARGFHIAYTKTDGMLGSPQAMEHWDAFYGFLVEKGLAQKVALEGVSRGGLFVYGFAARWPGRVACIYADTPVLDFKSWPGGRRKGVGSPGTWKRLLTEYGFTEAEALSYDQNPVDRLEEIAKARIPLLHIVSLNDRVVPPEENTFVLAERYRKLGGTIDLIEVKEGTAKSQGHHFKHPDPLRVADFMEAHASAWPKERDYIAWRGSLDNCRLLFEREKKGRVAFVGGSITEGGGWRDATIAYLRQRFPSTEFDFVSAGISSTGSTPGAFRLSTDVQSRGRVDLLFEEAAVNDLHNLRSPTEMTRGMEGILRRARRANPACDLVVMHFVDPRHFADYHAGRVPTAIAQHERVATHYEVPTLHLSREVSDRIDAGQFSWKKDFKNLHPSPFGHRLYASTIRRLFARAWPRPLPARATVRPHPLPEALDPYSYDQARYVSIEASEKRMGFRLLESCDPRADGIGGGVRRGFHAVPMLVGEEVGDRFELPFRGRAVGLFVAAGPDAGIVEYRVDGGEWKRRDLFTKWSRGLHIPWAHILESELPASEHRLELRIARDRNPRSRGNACRIVHLLVNEGGEDQDKAE